tara:strand:+ start:1817 stop:1981 length:165 start_codon:yes stop_codon:yes gene_type:complete
MINMIASSDFSCMICYVTTFQGEESYFIDTPEYGLIRVCALCGIAAERLGWRLQ